MSELNNIIKNFNETLTMFVTYLRSIKNDDKDLLSLQTAIYALNKVNSKACLEQFILLVLEHGDYIINHDYNYFLNLDIDFSTDREKSMMKLLKFKEYSEELDNETRNNIFDFLELMVIQSRNFLKIKYQ